MDTPKKVRYFAWGLSGGVSLLSYYVWWQAYGGLPRLTIYQLFPLFGLLAFSLMWSHYIASVVRRYYGVDRAELRQYFEITSLVVLAAILLHPGLLAYQLWIDGFGLPPGSEINYVRPDLRLWVVLGMVSLVVFLTFELHRKFGDRPWWRFVSYASDVAMVVIYFHGLRLGGQLQGGWFRYVWYFYGITLLGSLIYIRVIEPRYIDKKA